MWSPYPLGPVESASDLGESVDLPRVWGYLSLPVFRDFGGALTRMILRKRGPIATAHLSFRGFPPVSSEAYFLQVPSVSPPSAHNMVTTRSDTVLRSWYARAVILWLFSAAVLRTATLGLYGPCHT